MSSWFLHALLDWSQRKMRDVKGEEASKLLIREMSDLSDNEG